MLILESHQVLKQAAQTAFAIALYEDTSLRLNVGLFVFLLKASEELLINFGVASSSEKGSKLDFILCHVFHYLS